MKGANMCKAMLLAWTLCFALPCFAGSGSSEEGNRLSTELNSHLIRSGLCSDIKTCYDAAPIYWRDGKTVELNLYVATNPQVVQEVFGFIAANGLRITNGKPIALGAFSKPKEAYVNSISGFIANRKPVASLRLEPQ